MLLRNNPTHDDDDDGDYNSMIILGAMTPKRRMLFRYKNLRLS